MATTQPTQRWSASTAPPSQKGSADRPATAVRPSPPTHELEHFVSRYRRLQPGSGPRAQDLLDSLGEIAPLHERLGPRGQLPSACHCLIEGYAAPDNARHLRDYLVRRGQTDIDILAIDLYDLPALYARIGCAMPPMRYRLADARNLRGILGDASIDLVVQDFLVNCMQPADVPILLAEVRRVLSPDGLAFISFTDDTCMKDVPLIEDKSHQPGLANPDALILPPPGTAAHRHLGRRFPLPGSTSWGFVTRPHGRLEFFSPLAQTLLAMDHQGLELLARSVSNGLDDHGLHCLRHRCILRRRPEAAPHG